MAIKYRTGKEHERDEARVRQGHNKFGQRPRSTEPYKEVMELHRTVGNRAVGLLIQPKLKVSQPDDPLEKEADRVADQVMSMQYPLANPQRMRQDKLHRKQILREIKEGEMLPRQSEEEKREDGLVYTDTSKDVSGHGPQSVRVPEAYLVAAMSGGGQPLSQSVRDFFEPRFHYDFGSVRVHTGVEAAKAAREMNSHAFAVGRDLVFGQGKYMPEGRTGKKLIAHELAHVVQQNKSIPYIQRQSFNPKIRQEPSSENKEELSKRPQLYQALAIARRDGKGIAFVSTDTVTLYAQTIGIDPKQVVWTVHGVSKYSGDCKPHTAANKGEFTFMPNPTNRPATASRRPNDPIIYRVEARAGTFIANLTLQQDETDIIRQEYIDFGAIPPARIQIAVPTNASLNSGNYARVVDNGMGVAFNAVQAAFEKATRRASKSLVPAISVSSGYRNPRRNVAAGSKHRTKSPHLWGRALDLTVAGANAILWHRLRQAGTKAGFASVCEQGPKVVLCSDPGVDHIHIQWKTPPPTYIEFETQHLVGTVPRTWPVPVEKTVSYTRRHKELMKMPPIPSEEVERFGEWESLKMEWERMTSPRGTSAFLADYKDRWVCAHRNIIKTAARKYAIPDWVLAGVAWTEVGGEPPWTDDLSYILGDIGIRGRPEKSSYGPVSIQIQRAAEELGYDPATLWSVQMSFIIHSLRKPQENLFIVASHLLRCKNVSSPAKPPDMLTDIEISVLGARYNRGVELSEKALLTQGNKTKYGDDLVKKKERMKKLLNE